MNWFDTLNDALDAEGLVHTWQLHFDPIQYDETFSYTHQDGTRYGHLVSIYRNERGQYERPIHYTRG